VGIGSTYKLSSAYGRFGVGNQQHPSALRVRTERGRLWSRTSAKSDPVALRNIATVFLTEDTNSPRWKSVGPRYGRHGAGCKAPRRRIDTFSRGCSSSDVSPQLAPCRRHP
jgi:hypothetical protein